MAEEMVPKAVVDLLMQQLQQQSAMFQQELSALRKQIEELNAIIREKDQIILNQNRARFGRSSEKTICVFPAGQMSMFDVAGDGHLPVDAANATSAPETPTEPEKIVTPVKGHTRKAKRTLEELFSTLAVEEIICDLPTVSAANLGTLACGASDPAGYPRRRNRAAGQHGTRARSERRIPVLGVCVRKTCGEADSAVPLRKQPEGGLYPGFPAGLPRCAGQR